MTNKFYADFDLERFPPTAASADDTRSPFQIERDRVVFSYPFRRLQSKTQVFQSGEYDFYRTRLTHSIEVAKIGRSICDFLRARPDFLGPDFYIDADLTEAICLAHDLGHPPFGHIGERQLNNLMADYGGFEGNAQTLRILTELIYERPGRTKGIAPTRAFLDGVMKYKAGHRELAEALNRPPPNHFIYDEQLIWRESIMAQGSPPDELATPSQMNAFKSIECQIMDWADDTAYSLHDIVDGIHARYISVGSLSEWASEHELSATDAALIETLCAKIRGGGFEPYFGSRVRDFVHGCSLRRREGFLSDRSQRHSFDLAIDPSVRAERDLYKRIASDLIFKSTQLQQIEFKGGHILGKLFAALSEHCVVPEKGSLQLLPPQVQSLIDGAEDVRGRHRRLCDYLAGLTDALAVRTYKRLYDADFGSILELP